MRAMYPAPARTPGSGGGSGAGVPVSGPPGSAFAPSPRYAAAPLPPMQGYPGASYASSSSAAQHRGPPHPSAPLAAPPGHPHAAPPPPADVASPPARPAATVYLATYSNVPVYELTVRGIACMRRRADGFLNATQILKIAGVEKARRTKILEREILTGEHEKVQGGYGKYQGTW
jgi:hypothetical protein